MTHTQRLTDLDACPSGLACESATLREWWDTTTTLDDMTWLLGQAHRRGTLTRRRLVAVSLRAVETCVHLMPEACVAPLGRLCDWVEGDDSVDLAEVRQELWTAYAAAATLAGAVAANAAAATTFANAAAYAYDVEACAAQGATCDILRDAITIDEVCAALSLDPNQGV
jgi:hypothetical protein